MTERQNALHIIKPILRIASASRIVIPVVFKS